VLTLLVSAAVAAAGLSPVPLPVPLLPTASSPPSGSSGTQQAQVEVSGDLDAADGRLRRGCKDYQYAYTVTVPTQDWTFDITLQDRAGKGVNSQSLIGPNDAETGVLPYRLCRWATKAGRFTLTGVLVSYDGAQETSVSVTETFRLRRRNR
jgi:hypothetical protein